MKYTMRALITAGVSALFATSILVATPIAAQAYPSNCTAFVGTDRAGYASCYGGTGYYKVGIACRPTGPFGQYGYGFTKQGNWARTGGAYKSIARCPLGTSNWSPNGSGTYYAWIDQTANNI